MDSNLSKSIIDINHILSIEHYGQCVPSQKRKVSKSPPKKDIKVSFEGAHEKLLVLREENMHLKSKGRELEDEVKL